jgi:hypothetical protein
LSKQVFFRIPTSDINEIPNMSILALVNQNTNESFTQNGERNRSDKQVRDSVTQLTTSPSAG